jgi:hypothetical protein
MVCPVCEADAVPVKDVCPHCGAALPMALNGEVRGIVEGTAQRGPISAELPLLAEGEGEGAAGPARAHATSLTVTRPALPAVLWQQPAVRAVAQAGAGAVALTLGLRLLRAWLARPRAAHQVVSSALPLMAELIEQGGRAGEPPTRRGERGTEMVETVIYVQRVMRRR